MDGDYRRVSQINPFLTKLFWSGGFITAIETQIRKENDMRITGCRFGENCGRIQKKPHEFSKLGEMFCGSFKTKSIEGNAHYGVLACEVLGEGGL